MEDFNVVSFSGGKDSTAMLFGMLERGIPIGDVVFFDTGWEFPEMHDHIKLVEEKSGLKVTVLAPPVPFDYIMLHKKVIEKKTTKVKRIGYGWPSDLRRWCTRLKINTIQRYLKGMACVQGRQSIKMHIGFAFDEIDRAHKEEQKNTVFETGFPLIEWGWDEAKALQYCYSLGFDWRGLYKVFDRVSCFQCPLKTIEELRRLRSNYPRLWKIMLDKNDSMTIQKFKNYKSLRDLDKRFLLEELDGI